MASISAKSIFIPLLKKFPELEVIPQSNCLEKFDYYYTCALMFVVMIAQSDKGVQVARKRALNDWHKGSFTEVTRLANQLHSKKIFNLDDIGTYVAGWIFYMTASNPINPQISDLYTSGEIPRYLGKIIIEQVKGFYE